MIVSESEGMSKIDGLEKSHQARHSGEGRSL
jgi:hypothetical protein